MLIERPVAFHSVIRSPAEKVHIGIGQKIMFPDVMMNLGVGGGAAITTFMVSSSRLSQEKEDLT